MKRLATIGAAAVLVLVAGATAVTAGDRTFVAVLSADQEVPSNASAGRGVATFRLSADGTELSYRLVAANIDNVIASHIHIAPAGTNGSVVVFLYGPAAAGGGAQDGVLATGTITSANLTGPLAGQSLADLLAQMESGNAYVNVHTNDGVAPTNTGPGDFPGGEIRGQIR